jgi:hypothetical protein
MGGMSRRTAARLAWSLWALCVGFVVLAVLLDFYTPPTRHDPNFAVLVGIPLLVYSTIGAVVVSRRPRNAVGWILCGMGLVFEGVAFSRAYAANVLSAHPPRLWLYVIWREPWAPSDKRYEAVTCLVSASRKVGSHQEEGLVCRKRVLR